MRTLDTMPGVAIAAKSANGADTAATLTTYYGTALVDAAGKPVTAVLLQAETQSLRVSIGGTPTAGGSPSQGLLLTAGSSIAIIGRENVLATKVMNAVAESVGVLNIQPFVGD